MKNWIKSNYKKIIIVIIYEIITFTLLFFHEQWRDEAQAWLLSKNLTISELIAQLKYEGHYIVWYLIIMPFSKLNFPYITIDIISWVITSMSAILIIFKAPCELYKKVLIVFSFPMLYLYPVIARCYCLIPLAIVLMSILYKDRFNKPILYVLAIGLLANTHVIMLGMVGVVLLEFFIEAFVKFKDFSKKQKRKIIISLVLICILLLSILPLFGSLGQNKDLRKNNKILSLVKNAIFYQSYRELDYNFYILESFKILECIFAIILLYVLIYYYRKNKINFFEILLILLWQFSIYSFIWGSSFQKASTIIFIVLFFKWRKKEEFKYKKEDSRIFNKKINEICILIIMIVNIMGCVLFSFFDVKFNYSSAKQLGNYINDNIEDDVIFISGEREEYLSAIIPYISENIYAIKRKQFISYAIWDEKNQYKLTKENVMETIEEFKDSKLYYIFSRNTHDLFNSDKNNKEIIEILISENILIKVFETDQDFFAREEYILYKVNN